ncbi:glycerophosphodiester phosphodiesterase family protein [Candidatus Stoquefichus massiliensis]|uniref:glycerophosphodiester phosphodiesterase family protein n=1 Tax=Candidatus Stoquefichus massiliensis TaxID=1470350 RepID=UPI0004836AD9|nr:glycerophosphodiester phosphodiesterase family protein [Candidatus Stoquefichus massiliensis]
MEKMKKFQYYQLLKNIVKFEIFYKIVVLLFLSPILRKILKEYLDSVSYGIAFNQDMIFQFLSIKGLIVFLVLFLIMVIVIYYELYVIIHIIALDVKHKSYSLRQIMLKSFIRLKSLHYSTFIICGVYTVLLLPLVHIGYLNSYIPRWDIPHFIFGELSLTTTGNILICLIYLLYYSLFVLTLFTPIYMALKQQNILQSIKSSYFMIKQMNIMNKIKILCLIFSWVIIEYLVMNILPYPILHNRDFNRYFIKYLINSSAFRYSAIQYVVLAFILVIAMTFFIRYLIKIVMKNDQELITIDDLPIQTDQMNQRIIQFKNFVMKTIKMIKDKVNQIQFYQHHKRIVQVVLLIIILCLGSLYLRRDAYVHRPWVIGHRGSGYYIENTYEAIKDANDSGADYAEIDIQLSKDGIPVVFHDSQLSRLSDVNASVLDMTAEELEKIELKQKGMTSHIMTLEELIIKMKEEKLHIGLLIELKPVQGNGENMAEKIIEIIEEQHFSKQSIFMSLDYPSAQYLNQLKPEWWVGYCIYSSVGDIDDSIWDMNMDFLAIEENRASTSFVQKAVKHMLPVYVWTVDHSKRMKQYLDMGVSGLITNYPDLGKMIIEEYEKQDNHYYYYDGKSYPQRAW